MTTPSVEPATTTTTEAVQFVAPLPGLGASTSFALEAIPGAEGLFALRAAEAGLRLFVLEPVEDRYGYAPVVPRSALEQIGVDDEADVRLLVVANPSDDGVFLNLRAPIVIDCRSGRALQVILEDQAYPVRAPLGG